MRLPCWLAKCSDAEHGKPVKPGESTGKQFNASAGVKNVGDIRYLMSCVTVGVVQAFEGVYNRGLEWTVTVGAKFRPSSLKSACAGKSQPQACPVTGICRSSRRRHA